MNNMLDFIESEVYPREKALEVGPATDLWHAEMAILQNEAKRRGLWALGHPKEVGGGGLSLIDYSYVNEAIGRSSRSLRRGTASFQDALLLHDWASRSEGPTSFPWWLVRSCRRLDDEPAVGSSDPRQLETTLSWWGTSGW